MNAAAVVLVAALLAPRLAGAAEIKVVSTLNLRPALDEIAAAYERESGTKILFQSQGAAATEALVAKGVPGDLVIHARPTLERLEKRGRVKGPFSDIARASIGVAVREGAPRPDISSDAAFRQVLLSAKSLAYPDPKQGSLGGNYLAALFRQWGIAKTLAPKLILAPGGAPAGQLVADGKAEFGVNQVAEIMRVKGIAFLAPLPPALVNKVVMAAALLPQAKNREAAEGFIRFLASPEAAPAIRAHGMTP